MTDAELFAVVRQGADRLLQIPEGKRENALAEMKLAAEKIAVSVGLSPGDGAVFADDLIEALRMVAALVGLPSTGCGTDGEPRASDEIDHSTSTGP